MRTRRHTSPMFASLRSAPWHRFARDLGLVALTFVVGYALSAYWISPGGLTGSDHAVPRVLEHPAEDARRTIASGGFRARMAGERPNGRIPRGRIVWQDPPPGTVAPPNTTVELVTSSGAAAVPVPDVVGFALPYAERVLRAAGVKVGRVDTVHGGDPERGVVLVTRPGAGNGRPPGAPVDLMVSGLQEGSP